MPEREFRRDKLDFGSFERSRDSQLVTALVVVDKTDQLRMAGWQTREAVDLTFELGQMVFYSRERNQIWVKGETSGNKLIVVRQAVNCDNSTIKYYVEPAGPTCHLNTETCFDEPNS